jgi:predicted alpha/beta hydrolase family esterase
MVTQVIAIHGAGEPRRRGGSVYWEPMLRDGLGDDYEVTAPRMPDPEDPHHEPWATRIAGLVAHVPRPILIGHSFGASTLLKFMASAPRRPTVAGLFLVATPFWDAKFPEYALTARELVELRQVSPMTFYHSTDDPELPLEHFERYQRELPEARFRQLNGRGHEFDQPTFPELIADIRALS